jgi:hypothetical protein
MNLSRTFRSALIALVAATAAVTAASATGLGAASSQPTGATTVVADPERCC